MSGAFYNLIKNVQRALGLRPTIEDAEASQSETTEMIEDACRAIDEVKTQRHEFYEDVRRRPLVADVLISARDRT